MEKFRITKAQTIGLFVLLTLVTIFVVINFLKGQDLFNKTTKYYTTFDNVEGLTATGPVYIRGLKVGTIESIKYNNIKDLFVVKLTVKSDYIIPINSKAELYSADILGSKSVRINLGNSNMHAKANDTISGFLAPDMLSMLSKEIGPLKDQAALLINNMNKTLDNLNTILDSNARVNIQGALLHLNKTTKNAESLSKNLNDISPELKEMITNLNTLSKGLSAGSDNITHSLKNIDSITTALSEAKLKETIENLNSLLIKIQDPNGSIGKMLTTDELHNSVDSLVNNVNTLIERITANPKKYIKISVF